jgi:hypothetical protein
MKTPTPRLKKFDQLVVDLNIQWQMFDDLYKPSEHYAIFNRVGPSFWNHLQSYLLDAIFVSISRFFDPAVSNGKENLSLLAVIEFDEVQSIRCKLHIREKEIRKIWKKGINLWRHKQLSHSDMAIALEVNTLPEVPFSDIKDIITSISEFAREINIEIYQYDVSYQIGTSHWVPQVIDYLKRGIEQKEIQTSGA